MITTEASDLLKQVQDYNKKIEELGAILEKLTANSDANVEISAGAFPCSTIKFESRHSDAGSKKRFKGFIENEKAFLEGGLKAAVDALQKELAEE